MARTVRDYLEKVETHVQSLVLLLASVETNDPFTYAQRERIGKAVGALIRESERAMNKALKHGTTKQTC
jgi:hypothetical protein